MRRLLLLTSLLTTALPPAGECRLEPLRRLRDRTLLPTPLGRLAIAAYYALSPALAEAIAGDERLRRAARRGLTPLAGALTATER